ncbi:hypothetical protein ACFQ60_09375 [Streptomyces zhihengii]
MAAQTAVQESRGGSAPGSDEGQAAAEQQKGTGVAADGAGAERASAPAAPAKPAPAEPAAAPEPQQAGATAPASPSPARDSHVTGGGSRTEDRPAPSAGGGAKAPAPRAPEAPAPAAAPAPKGAGPAKSGAAPARRAAPAARGRAAEGAVAGAGRRLARQGREGPGPGARPLGRRSRGRPRHGLEAQAPQGARSHGRRRRLRRSHGRRGALVAGGGPAVDGASGGSAPDTAGKPRADAPAAYAQDPAAKSEAPRQEDAEVTGAKAPEGQIEAEKAEEPGGWDTFKMALGFGIGKVLSWVGFEVDASELAAKFAGLPTKDEALAQAQAGNAPGVEMQGAAERTAGEQGSAVDTKGQETVATGRDDAGRPMGEDQVYPDAPKERMAAKVPGGQGGAGGPRPAAPRPGPCRRRRRRRSPSTSAGPSSRRRSARAASRCPRAGRRRTPTSAPRRRSTGRRWTRRSRPTPPARPPSATARWRTSPPSGPAGERSRTRNSASWATRRPNGTRRSARTSRTRRSRPTTTSPRRRTTATGRSGTRTPRPNATRRRSDDSVEDSGNWVTKAFDWIKKKVIEIKDAIVRVIKAARDAVVGFIKNFKETVERWIDAARKFVVDTIKQLIDDLVEFAKAMVRAIVELAARVRKFVTDLIAAAIALVNRLADALKQAVSDLLDAIGKLLGSILDFLKKMLQAAVKAVVDAVKAVLDFASKLLSALGDWMLIAVDFLSDPGGWLGGAKNSAVDGAKNHLFAEVSSAVKQWFREKIQEIIGVPKAVIDKLVRGGWTLDKIVKEAWDAVVPQLPLIIGELVLTKVVAKLIPGAGWVMAVIDAIRTAWGALSAILRALGMVLDWLKAVRGGGAGILFAKAVAAGVVALLEVLYQALLSGIGKYVSKVGRRLKDVAAKLGKPKPGKPKGPGAPDAPADGRPAKPEDRAPGRPGTPPKDRPTDPKRPAPPKAPAPPKKPADRPKPLSTTAPTRPKDSARPDRPRETSRPQDTATPKPRTTDPSRPRDTGRPDRPGDRTPDRDPKRRDDTSPTGAAPTGTTPGAVPARRTTRTGRGAAQGQGRQGQGPQAEGQGPGRGKAAEKGRTEEEGGLQGVQGRAPAQDRRAAAPEIELGSSPVDDRQGLRVPAPWSQGLVSAHGSFIRTGPAVRRHRQAQPEQRAAGGFRLTGAELRELVHEVSRDMLQDPRVQAAAIRMRLEKMADPDATLDVNSAADFPGAVEYLRGRGSNLAVSTPSGSQNVSPHQPPVDAMENYRVGQDREPVQEQNKQGEINAYTQIELGSTKSGKPIPSTYPNIAKKIEELAAEGLQGPTLAGALHSFTTFGRMPGNLTPPRGD